MEASAAAGEAGKADGGRGHWGNVVQLAPGRQTANPFFSSTGRGAPSANPPEARRLPDPTLLRLPISASVPTPRPGPELPAPRLRPGTAGGTSKPQITALTVGRQEHHSPQITGAADESSASATRICACMVNSLLTICTSLLFFEEVSKCITTGQSLPSTFPAYSAGSGRSNCTGAVVHHMYSKHLQAALRWSLLVAFQEFRVDFQLFGKIFFYITQKSLDRNSTSIFKVTYLLSKPLMCSTYRSRECKRFHEHILKHKLPWSGSGRGGRDGQLGRLICEG
ncbi:uncharacterized protein LOC124691086 [Lolium rigidum]|uniref:uncharacterized protein LOC124691086 n=1 Tax=Lolium rigidum TaxID=89674 RepID=UPI001F5C75BA|nr:uncharacterized protein LOC124691086 [Lolium rigidum]